MPLQQSDFDFVQKLVQQKAAIVLDSGKQYFVESRLTPLAQDTGHGSIEKLIQDLKRQPGTSKLLERVVEAITIHETSFFRDIHQGLIDPKLDRISKTASSNPREGDSKRRRSSDR